MVLMVILRNLGLISNTVKNSMNYQYAPTQPYKTHRKTNIIIDICLWMLVILGHLKPYISNYYVIYNLHCSDIKQIIGIKYIFLEFLDRNLNRMAVYNYISYY